MALSQLARSINESPTLALNEKAMRLRERGEAVVNLGIGEPKNKTPIAAVHAAAAKLAEGDIKYTPADGLLSLKKAVLRYTEDHYGRMLAPENVIICPGAKMALFNALFTILNPQDEVILLAPYWVSYPEMVRMLYGQPVVVTPEDGTFHPRRRTSKKPLAPTPRPSSSTARTILPVSSTTTASWPSWWPSANVRICS
jgi:aspartate aminotransferase